MSDILELGKAVNEKCQSKDGSVDHRYWAFRSVELLPALIAEVERLRAVPTWEATDERIAAMKDACNFLVYAEIRNKGVNPGNVNRAKNAGDVLRAMLEEGKRDA